MQLVSSSVRRTLSFVAVFLIALTYAVPAFAAEEGGADATHHVEVMKTEHKWFYWPGWAFTGLTLAVIAIMAFAYWKSVAGPKYRGRKVAQ